MVAAVALSVAAVLLVLSCATATCATASHHRSADQCASSTKHSSRWVVERMLPQAEVDFLLQMYDKFSLGGDLHDIGNHQAITNPSDRERVASIVDTVTKQINQLSLRSSDYTPYTLIRSTPREGVAVHADNSRWNPTAGQWEPNHTPWRTFTASVMLSDPQGYSGGSLRFHGEQAEAFHMASGDGMVFGCGGDNAHSVDPVRSGMRLVLLVWLQPSHLHDVSMMQWQDTWMGSPGHSSIASSSED